MPDWSPLDQISSRSEDVAEPRGVALASVRIEAREVALQQPAAHHVHSSAGSEDGGRPSNPLPPMQPEDQDVLQKREHIRFKGDVDEESSSEHAFQKSYIKDHASSGLPRKIPYDLLEEITDGFSDAYKLGSGAFGQVYMMRIMDLIGACATRIMDLIRGICNGLKYLHEESNPPIYHLDLKPANVLLDEKMLPKIADFGLSRFFGEEQTKITQSSVGTLGYLPPEYIERNIISSKFDIFSLGVVITDIMTGRTGYNKCWEMTSPQEFIELAHENWRIRLQKTPEHMFESYSEQVKRCLEIALSCVETDRHKRPSIGDIVKQLNETEILIQKSSQLPDRLRINDHNRWIQGMSTTKVKRVGEYELGGIISGGTFAKVRFARNAVTGEPVAIKILDKEKVLKHKTVEQIKRDISVMKLVKHHYVVRIYEVMASKTKIYIVLEYATDGGLFEKIVKYGQVPECEARKYFQQLITAVDYCHSRGVYHRNLTHKKLLLDSYGDLKVSGFGLSALSQEVKEHGLLHTTRGTPNFVAPEVDVGGYDGAAADIWSCGVILYVLLAGYLPFQDSNLTRLREKIASAEFKFPEWMPVSAKNLLYRILDPNPMTRITISQILEYSWFKKDYDKLHVKYEKTFHWLVSLKVPSALALPKGSSAPTVRALL